MSSVNKRLLKELLKLTNEQNKKILLDNDYLISFDESNYNKVSAIIKGPIDSVYRHKFIRLNFDIPSDYPHSPPKVIFVNNDNVRIHPNMYEDGKCCSTILNTWPSDNEKWTSSMGIETILLAFSSFLDNNPYTYEPGGRDDFSYTQYVMYQSWKSCLLNYVNVKPEIFLTFINNYLLVHLDDIFEELYNLQALFPYNVEYTKCFEINNYVVNYGEIISKLDNHYSYIDYKENYEIEDKDLDYETFVDKIGDYKCNICFDSHLEDIPFIKLNCNHSFHIKCMSLHIKNNGDVCSMCRTVISEEISESLKLITQKDEWVINPNTKRKIKIGSKTYNKLILDGIVFTKFF